MTESTGCWTGITTLLQTSRPANQRPIVNPEALTQPSLYFAYQPVADSIESRPAPVRREPCHAEGSTAPLGTRLVVTAATARHRESPSPSAGRWAGPPNCMERKTGRQGSLHAEPRADGTLA